MLFHVFFLKISVNARNGVITATSMETVLIILDHLHAGARRDILEMKLIVKVNIDKL